MTSDELDRAAVTLHGRQHGAIQALADRLGVRYDSLRHMVAGRRPVPPGIAERVRELLATTRRPAEVTLAIASPPASLHPHADRDEPCGQAIDAALDALLAGAVSAGWHPAEIAAAVLGWAVERIADGAGTDAARQALDDAGELLALRAS